MPEYRRDALLAGASCTAVLAGLAVAGSLATLLAPTAAIAGIGAALFVEGLFVADARVAALWERAPVRALAVAALLGGTAALAWVAGPWALAAACWGLATYFALLALIATGVWSVEN